MFGFKHLILNVLTKKQNISIKGPTFYYYYFLLSFKSGGRFFCRRSTSFFL